MGNMNNWEGRLKYIEGLIVILKQVKSLEACNWGATKTKYIDIDHCGDGECT